MKCKYCGFEAPVISMTGDPKDVEFIDTVEVDEHTIIPILKCPKCGREQVE